MSGPADQGMRTPLYQQHVDAGARMVEFAGWQMPVQYTSIVAEHHAVRTAAGIFDVSHMGEIEISGAAAEDCCCRLFSNDASRLAPGRAQYSLIVNEEGGTVDDIIVYRLEAERFFVCVNAANAAKDFAWIDERAPAGATIKDVSAEYALLALQGPAAVSVVEQLTGAEGSSDLPERFCVGRVEVASVPVLLARTGYTGEDGFEMFVPAQAATQLWRAVLDAGRQQGVVPVGLGARDTLRLEASLPLYGHELGEDINAYEAGLGWAVKLNRPHMTGYGALASVRETGPRRRLLGLEVEGGIARNGHMVVAGEKTVGTVTSGSHCPTLGKALALALVEADSPREGLAVDVRGKARGVRVTDLPFYVRQRHLTDGQGS